MTGVPRLFGCVEAGGTKFVCAIGNDRGDILAQERFPTADPASTLAATQAFLRQRSQPLGTLAAIGIASFGPVELDKTSARYGFIGKTPKPGWGSTDIAGILAREFSVPGGFPYAGKRARLAERR